MQDAAVEVHPAVYVQPEVPVQDDTSPEVKVHVGGVHASATASTAAAGAVYVHPPALSHVDESPTVKPQSTEAAHESDTAAV